MAEANTPWSLKGISDEAREIAKSAAGEANLPVGAWLSQVIHIAAHQEQSDDLSELIPTVSEDFGVAQADTEYSDQDDQENDNDANTIERAVQVVNEFGFEPEGPARDVDLVQDRQILEDKLHALEARLAQSSDQQSDVIVSLHSEIARVRRQLDNLG